MLNLFDLDSVDESVIGDGISFDKKDIARNLTLFLYPDDSDEDGRLLRIYQQYFMVSAGAQLILNECAARGCNYHDLADYAAIQINDTHPSMVIPELIRLLEEHGISFDEAVQIVTDTCAYTNHTILAEALEKWPRHYLDTVVPQLMPIIEKLDDIAKTRTTDSSLAIIDQNQVVHMAHMDIHFSHSTNGVAALHTQILKESELAGFYQMYPNKFNNKTNGITFRRWLLKCNPALTSEIESLIGSGFKKDASELKKLLNYTDDAEVLKKLSCIKKSNKEALASWLEDKQGIKLNTNAMFSIQSKRLHEYKRQQLNLLFLIHEYLEIKAGHTPVTPLVSIFGAKAAPAYIIARKIQSCKTVKEACGKSSKTTISKTWFRFLLFDICKRFSDTGKCFTNFIIQTKVDQVVGKQFSNQEFGRNIIQFSASYWFYLFLTLFLHKFQKGCIKFCVGSSCNILLAKFI